MKKRRLRSRATLARGRAYSTATGATSRSPARRKGNRMVELPEWLDRALDELLKQGYNSKILDTKPVPTLKIWRIKK